MIIAKFNKNIKLHEVDDFVTKLKNKAKKKNKVMLDVKLTDKDCTIFISQNVVAKIMKNLPLRLKLLEIKLKTSRFVSIE